MKITIPYSPRPQQREIHDLWEEKRFGIVVCHRRMGKSVCFLNDLLREAIRTEKHEFRAAYIAPTYTQAKAIAWDYLRYYTKVLPKEALKVNESELRIDLANGSRVRLFGADNPDSLRGLYFDRVVFDEYDLCKPSIWTEVVRPALADRLGSAAFVGTFKYIDGPLGQLWDETPDDDPDWFKVMYKLSETEIIPESEVEVLRRSMSKEEFDREFECIRNASLRGAILGPLVDQADAEGRIHDELPYEPKIPVSTAWDLGIADATAIWFAQVMPTGAVHLIDYLEDEGEGLHYYARQLQERNFIYGDHIAPPDIAVRELGTGTSRFEVAAGLGINFRVLQKTTKHQRSFLDERIEAARMLLPRCHFDRQKCKVGLRALRSWRREPNEKTGALRAQPIHDEFSHGADAFTHLGLGVRKSGRAERPEIRAEWVT